MTYAIPVIDLEDVPLEAVRAATQELGAVQVVNHGVPGELSAGLERRMARLLSLPQAEKARLASPGRHRVVAGGTVTRRSTAVFVYPALDTVVEPAGPFAAGSSGFEPVLVWDHVKDRVADYLAAYGRPEQIAAWRDGTPYVAELAGHSAGRS
jgi:isopenicillin N synthase-like dioxygenase